MLPKTDGDVIAQAVLLADCPGEAVDCGADSGVLTRQLPSAHTWKTPSLTERDTVHNGSHSENLAHTCGKPFTGREGNTVHNGYRAQRLQHMFPGTSLNINTQRQEHM